MFDEKCLIVWPKFGASPWLNVAMFCLRHKNVFQKHFCANSACRTAFEDVADGQTLLVKQISNFQQTMFDRFAKALLVSCISDWTYILALNIENKPFNETVNFSQNSVNSLPFPVNG